MKNKIALAVLVVILLAAGIYFKGFITGMVIAEDSAAPQITISKLDVFKDSAYVKWQTDENAISYFQLQGKTEIFSESNEFGMTIESLNPGKEYSYTISACDKSSNCNQKSGFFTTLAQEKQDTQEKEETNQITGAAVTNISGVGAAINKIFFVLLLVAATVILLGGVFRENAISVLPPSIRLGMMLDKAENLIKEKRHEELHGLYTNIRHTYNELDEKNKGKYQPRALDVYSELEAHTKAKEANVLVDKYLEGNITKQEFERLRDLLEA